MSEQNPKEWTLMFYFASDNPLAPNAVTQLKQLTNAGFHQDINVVAKFDPQTEGTDTHVFDVNMVNKLFQKHVDHEKRFKFWGEKDPFIRNLVFDKLWSKADRHHDDKIIREHIARVIRGKFEEIETKSAEPKKSLEYNPPDPRKFIDARLKKLEDAEKARVAGGANHAERVGDQIAQQSEGNPKEPGPKESLEDFLEFCAKSYPANHYMLFLVGHGLIVGNDMFLFDEHATESSLSLKNLAAALEKFTAWVGDKKLDLLAFHSCSMSAIEVAYELKNSAKYMLASQGPEFIGSWPYREILIRVFNDQITYEKKLKDKKKNKDKNESRDSRNKRDEVVRQTIEKIFEYVVRNSYDFQLAGYSFDLCLSNLEAVDQITAKLHDLASLMTECLQGEIPFVKEAILLAHWDAQSFWQDSYTDLYDFCWCLRRRCVALINSSEQAKRFLHPIVKKCEPIINALESEVRVGHSSEHHYRRGNGSVIRAAFAGPQYQYSHGLSIYFPWSEPANQFFWNEEYKGSYAFTQTGWAEFLQSYFDTTQRKTVHQEIVEEFGTQADSPPSELEFVLDMITRKVFNVKGPLNHLSGPDRRDIKGGGGSWMDSSKAGGGSSMGSDIKAGGGSSMGFDIKAGGGSSTGFDIKAGGGSSMGFDSKAGGGSSMGFDNKAGGGSSMGFDIKAGGGSSMGIGGGSASALKPGGESSHGGDCDCPGTKNHPSFTRNPIFPETSPDDQVKSKEVKTASPDFYDILTDF